MAHLWSIAYEVLLQFCLNKIQITENILSHNSTYGFCKIKKHRVHYSYWLFDDQTTNYVAEIVIFWKLPRNNSTTNRAWWKNYSKMSIILWG